MVPEIDKLLEQTVSEGVSPEDARRLLIAQGKPEGLVNDVVDSWLLSHGRKHRAADYEELIRRYKSKAFASLVVIGWFGLLFCLVTLLKPWPTKIMVDSAFGDVPATGALAQYSGTADLILITSVMTLVIFILAAALSTARDYFLTKYSYKITAEFKQQVFRHILHISQGRGRFSKGDYIYRQNNLTNSLADYVLGSVAAIIQAIVMIVAIVVLMLVLNVRLALICIVLIPTLYLLAKLFVPKVSTYTQKLTKNNSSSSSIVTESIDNAETVQAYEMTDSQVRQAQNLWSDSYQFGIRGILLSRMYRTGSGFFVIITIASVMYFGGVQALHGNITLGELLIFMTYVSYLLSPAQNLANQLNIRSQKKQNVKKVHEVLAYEEGVENRWEGRHLPISQRRIVFENVGYSYGNQEVLKNINLTIEPQQKIGIVGESGSGKSTLLKLFLLFVEPTRGRISIDNIDVQTVSLLELRRQVAYVAQEPQLFNVSLLENIANGASQGQTNPVLLEKITRDMGVYDFAQRISGGINARAGEGGNRLSGGQKQRVSLARGLAKQTPIICLDEPTSALDSDSETKIKNNLSEHLFGKTVILVSHRKSLLTLMDKVYVLKDGSLHDINQFGGLDKYLASVGDTDNQWLIQQQKIEEERIKEQIKQEEAKQQEQETTATYDEPKIAQELGGLSDDTTLIINH